MHHFIFNLTYIFVDLPRVKALNLAINNSKSDYLLRFDSRTRFSNDYAKNAIDLLEKSNKKYVGGVPTIIPEKNTFWGNICASIMSRSYIFLYPRHRRFNYEGEASSVYLGCFEIKTLRLIMYRDELNIISEFLQTSLTIDISDKVPFNILLIIDWANK